MKGGTELRLAVVSPFLDRQHGTELCVIEQLERLAQLENWTIELYAQRVEHLDGVHPTAASPESAQRGIAWHRVSEIPGPHLLQYLWWFVANHWQRRRDRRSGKPRPDLVYSPGINCFDADVIVVHIVFHAFYDQVRPELALRRATLRNWPRLIHRKLYYRLIMFLENMVYRDPRARLVSVSALVAKQLQTCFGRNGIAVIPNAVDTSRFTLEARRSRRAESREALHLADKEFVVLLIGNDWKNKGLDALLRAAVLLRDVPLRLLVAGADDPGLYTAAIHELALKQCVQFAKPSPDVLQFYAAADLYAGPSLEDAFGLPILEAMACGLPVIASVHAGASENITDGKTGFLLHEPQNYEQLAGLIRRLYADPALRESAGKAAAEYAAANCSWDRNAEQTRKFLENTLNERTSQRRPIS